MALALAMPTQAKMVIMSNCMLIVAGLGGAAFYEGLGLRVWCYEVWSIDWRCWCVLVATTTLCTISCAANGQTAKHNKHIYKFNPSSYESVYLLR